MQYGPVPDFPLSGKIVAITGGGSGIGFAFATLCHARGARVLVGDLKLTEEAAKYISESDNSASIDFQVCDVTSWQSLHDLISASVDKFGDVPDVYAPVAGVYEPSWSNFWNDDEDESYKALRINVEHPIKFTRLAMRALAGSDKQGVVCLVASTAGIRGNYFAALYATSKHAIVGFAKSMGQADPKQGVKVVCVLPGAVQSPLWEDRDDDVAKETNYHERQLMQPSEIAEVMMKMVEKTEYAGGTCVLKTAMEEKTVEEGWDKAAGKHDPSPRPEADMSRIMEVLNKERGKKWQR